MQQEIARLPETDTIAAAATGAVRAAIGIARLSGPQAVRIAGSVFTPASGKALEDYPPHTLVYGTLHGTDGAALDQCLAVYARAPGSYTGEDTAELQCHGSPELLALALEAVFSAGARQALPGEFTRRAFLNGRLDLTQAEAVIDLIDAETPDAVKCAAGQLAGALSRRVQSIYDRLIDLSAHFHAVLDYPDEDIQPLEGRAFLDTLEQCAAQLRALAASSRRGRQLTHGVPCAIAGLPNAGKSSLLNALLGCERAIVTDIPGTTRDTIEARCSLGGVLVRLVDTAGIREHTADPVERLGVARSRAALEEADCIFLVLDSSVPLSPDSWALIKSLTPLAPRRQIICVLNKSDLPCALSGSDCSLLERQFPHLCRVSAADGAGLDALERAVADCFPAGESDRQGAVLTNARQEEAARRALRALEGAAAALGGGMTPDAVLSDVELALDALGQLSGRTVRDDVTDRIFSRFCVGK